MPRQITPFRDSSSLPKLCGALHYPLGPFWIDFLDDFIWRRLGGTVTTSWLSLEEGKLRIFTMWVCIWFDPKHSKESRICFCIDWCAIPYNNCMVQYQIFPLILVQTTQRSYLDSQRPISKRKMKKLMYVQSFYALVIRSRVYLW